jgi:hypothetical protein
MMPDNEQAVSWTLFVSGFTYVAILEDVKRFTMEI